MANTGGKPRISRELINRLNRHTDDGSHGLGDGPGLRPGLNNLQVAKRGRKIVGEYKHSVIGARQAASAVNSDFRLRSPGRAQQDRGLEPGLRSTAGPNQAPKMSFREPPARGHNPYS